MKKVLSIVLSLAMVVCLMPVMAFAADDTAAGNGIAYSDISGENCEGAVNVLTALNVVTGYTDGTYKPNDVVSRSEMAQLVIKALGIYDYADATWSRYSDMNGVGDKWAIPVVEYASNLNIVKGYPDGRFGPDDDVTYQEAVTMIVRAIGYTDECNEMNGAWPAIYIQKATALGLFSDTSSNDKTKGATRGDIAIMLYNALDLPEVYADKDGATNYKNGTEEFSINGRDFRGVSMLSTLNEDGSKEYEVIDEQDADNAINNVRSYVGVAARVVKDKHGKILAVGDSYSKLLSGYFNSDATEFTAEGITYSVGANGQEPWTAFSSDGIKNLEKPTNTNMTLAKIPYYYNGEKITGAPNPSAYQIQKPNDIVDLKDRNCTLSVKIENNSISQIWAVMDWNFSKTQPTQHAMMTSDIQKELDEQSELLNEKFYKNTQGEIDTSKFILDGVNSLDDINEGNIIYVYRGPNSEMIRRIAVGTNTVTGTWTSYSEGDSNRVTTYNIDGTDYYGYQYGNRFESVEGRLSGCRLNDEVTAYLDYFGNIYTFNLNPGYSDYAVVLRVAPGIMSESLNTGTKAQIRVLTASGDYQTLDINETTLGYGNKYDNVTGVTIQGDTKGIYLTWNLDGDRNDNGDYEDDNIQMTIEPGDIVRYNAGEDAIINRIEEGGTTSGHGKTIEESASYDGFYIDDSAPIFVLEYKLADRNTGYEDNDVKVYRVSDLLNAGMKYNADYLLSGGQIVAMTIDNAHVGAVTSEYGIMTAINNTADKNYPVKLDILIGEDIKSYAVSDNVWTAEQYNVNIGDLVKITPDRNGKLSDAGASGVESDIVNLSNFKSNSRPKEVLQKEGRYTISVEEGMIKSSGENNTEFKASYKSDVVIYVYGANGWYYSDNITDAVNSGNRKVGLYGNTNGTTDGIVEIITVE